MRKFNDSFHKQLKLGRHCIPKQNTHIEIGCGVGWHPLVYSKNHPDVYLIAIEHTANKFEKFYKRYLLHNRPKNLLPVHANAISFITSCIDAESIERVLILYPNPYPLQKHKNIRFHNMPFMKVLISRLKLGGELILATNEEFYWQEASYIYQHEWGLVLENQRNLLFENEFRPRTHFEKKYLKRKQTCMELNFKKTFVS